MLDAPSLFSKVALIGSCISAETLRALGIRRAQRAADCARTSLASLTRPPGAGAPAFSSRDLLEGLALAPNVQQWLEAELSKSALPAIAARQPDLLLFDFIDERFDLLVLDGVAFNQSWDFVHCGLSTQPAFARARRVERLSDEAWSLWDEGLSRLRAWKESALPRCAVALHRAFWAARMRTPSGVAAVPDSVELMPGQTTSLAAHNRLLHRYYQRFLNAFPEAMVVEAPPDAALADAAHVWGPSPFHYVPEYHRAVADQLRARGLCVSDSTPELAEAKAALSLAAKQVREGPPQAGNENIHPEWQRALAALSQSVLEEDLETFTRWRSIASTMFTGDYPDTARQLAALRARPDWSSRWEPALVESPAGAPAPSGLHPGSSGNQIRQAYLLARFEDEAGRRIDAFDQIVELGGGFGALCLLAHRLGFGGRYVLIDNQPVRALHRWYLLRHGLPVAPDGDLSPASGICSISTLGLDEALRRPEGWSQAFLAHWSLCAAPEGFRDQIFRTLRRAQVDAIWVTFQKATGLDGRRSFAARIEDFAGVYEATSRPFQPEAPVDDIFYGHGCLALKRVAGRRFPPAVAELEPAPFDTDQMPYLTIDELHRQLRAAIVAGTPHCVIRLGDGEGRLIGYPKHVSRAAVADIWNTWFGRTDFDHRQLERVRSALKAACLESDAIGVPQGKADLGCEFGRVKALLPREGFVERSTKLCASGFHLKFQKERRYRSLLEGVPRVGIIGPRNIQEPVRAVLGVPEVLWLPVPPEMKFSNLPETERAKLISEHAHLTRRYDELIEAEIPRALVRWPGLVVLVGAGVLGKSYCRRVKQLGGIGIDVGSMMDLWAGLKTRENSNFDGLPWVSC